MPERSTGVSRYGVYYDLSKSPYEFTTPYGDLFKFSSAKKLEMYRRDIDKEKERFEKWVSRHDLVEFIPPEIVHLLYRAVYSSFYRKIEG